MSEQPSSIRFSSPQIAREIARSFGQKPQSIHVNMKGREDVTSLLSRVAAAKMQAHAQPLCLD